MNQNLILKVLKKINLNQLKFASINIYLWLIEIFQYYNFSDWIYSIICFNILIFIFTVELFL